MAMERDGDPTIRLGAVGPFRLGPVEVNPRTRQLVHDGVPRTIEPRILQLLVALWRAGGDVVTRDELIEQCWGGRIVTDHAINRAVSRLRELAAETGDGFRIETISKVGYRLVVAPERAAAEDAAPASDGPARIGRRTVAAGLIIGAASMGMVAVSKLPSRASPGDALVRRGWMALAEASRDQAVQAAAYFRRATELDPRSAPAWGGLALASRFAAAPGADMGRAAESLRAAAEKALALDPGNPDARVALLLMRRWDGHWLSYDRDLNGLLARHPDHPFLLSAAGYFLRSVGRNREALGHARKAVERAPLAAGYHADLGTAFRANNRLGEAQAVYDDAVRLWPQNMLLWTLRINFYLLSGRPDVAAEILADERTPPGVPLVRLELMRDMATHLGGGARPGRAASLIARIRALADKAPTGMLCNYLCALGGVEDAFGLLDLYYFDGAPGSREPVDRPRATDLLFDQPTRPLRDDPRFAALAARLGLEPYWRATATPPDYRRARPGSTVPG